MKKIKFFLIVLITVCYSAGAQTGGNRIVSDEVGRLGFTGMTYSEVIEKLGKMHNDYQEHMLSFIDKNIKDLKDTSTLRIIIVNESSNYFSGLGIQIPSSYFQLPFRPQPTQLIQGTSLMSTDAKQIATELNSLVSGFSETSDAAFLSSIATLKSRILNLRSEQEVLSLGVSVTVAESSCAYWKANTDKWVGEFSRFGNSGQTPTQQKGFHIGWGSMVTSDITGAYAGATGGGCGGGPAGAVAGGILGASANSCLNLFGQVFSNLFNWW